MAEQNSRIIRQDSRAIGTLTVNVDVSEGIKNLKRLQKEIRKTLQLTKELESKLRRNDKCLDTTV